jgi:hypothetical protein
MQWEGAEILVELQIVVKCKPSFDCIEEYRVSRRVGL